MLYCLQCPIIEAPHPIPQVSGLISPIWHPSPHPPLVNSSTFVCLTCTFVLGPDRHRSLYLSVFCLAPGSLRCGSLCASSERSGYFDITRQPLKEQTVWIFGSTVSERAVCILVSAVSERTVWIFGSAVPERAQSGYLDLQFLWERTVWILGSAVSERADSMDTWICSLWERRRYGYLDLQFLGEHTAWILVSAVSEWAEFGYLDQLCLREQTVWIFGSAVSERTNSLDIWICSL